MKTCTKCLVAKPLFEFTKMKNTQDGLKYACKSCNRENAKEWRKRNPEYHANWYKGNVDYSRNAQYRRRYNLTIDQVRQMVEDQDRRCAICNTELQGGQKQAVDHCHTTNKVRAILCHACNKGLGLFRENTDSLRKAAEYLEQHRGENPDING